MNRNILSMLGLCKKAGMLEIGEEPVEAVARAKVARVLLLAQDAADNTARRVRHFAEAGSCIWLRIPFTKEELGQALGRTSCAIVAVTDIGFAATIVRRMADEDPARYGESADRLELKARRAQERREEMLAHQRNVRLGKVKPKAPAPVEEAPPPPPRPAQRRAAGKPYRSGQRSDSGQRDAKRKSKSVHPADRFRNSRPVKKGKGSPRKAPGSQSGPHG